MELTLVVLAAGMGSRYGGLKQLDPVGPSGEIILDYSLNAAMRAGFTKVVFVIRRGMLDLFRESVGERYEGKITLGYSFQELEPLPEWRVSPPGGMKPWGTGHAVLSAAAAVKTPFIVINADDYYGASGFLNWPTSSPCFRWSVCHGWISAGNDAFRAWRRFPGNLPLR